MSRPTHTPGRRPGSFICAALLIVSSALTASGMHRVLYDAGHRLALPAMIVSVLAGLLNLSWYEVAYAVGGGLKMVSLYLAIPLIGAATGMAGGLLLLLGVRFARYVTLGHIALALTLGILALGVLLWRLYRGMQDPWRIVTVLAFMAAYAAWLVYFLRAPRPARTPVARSQPDSPRR